jgi:hypothetical protein
MTKFIMGDIPFMLESLENKKDEIKQKIKEL